MTTLRLNEIKKKIELVDRLMNSTGIIIHYVYGGKKLSLLLTDLDSAKALDKIGTIERYYTNKDSELIVVVDDGDRMWRLEWEIFAGHQELSEWEAIEIAARHEEDRQTRGVELFTAEFKKIPDMIKDFIDNPNKKIV